MVTIDTDFATLVSLGGHAYAGIVRLPDVPAARRIALMNQLLSQYSEDVLAGAVVTIRGSRIRVSRPR